VAQLIITSDVYSLIDPTHWLTRVRGADASFTHKHPVRIGTKIGIWTGCGKPLESEEGRRGRGRRDASALVLFCWFARHALCFVPYEFQMRMTGKNHVSCSSCQEQKLSSTRYAQERLDKVFFSFNQSSITQIHLLDRINWPSWSTSVYHDSS
jgi:hypothetical protein